ncbi:hypothetical protein HNR77_000245 [Paenibacillus sp. JGP012]|nr:hypothetical protein [Paenibacillus sp. JGP012]
MVRAMKDAAVGDTAAFWLVNILMRILENTIVRMVCQFLNGVHK